MTLKFLADENISPLTVKLVRELEYDIKDINEEGLTGIEDEDIVLEKFLKTKVLETKKLSKSLVILDPKKYRSRKKS